MSPSVRSRSKNGSAGKKDDEDKRRKVKATRRNHHGRSRILAQRQAQTNGRAQKSQSDIGSPVEIYHKARKHMQNKGEAEAYRRRWDVGKRYRRIPDKPTSPPPLSHQRPSYLRNNGKHNTRSDPSGQTPHKTRRVDYCKHRAHHGSPPKRRE